MERADTKFGHPRKDRPFPEKGTNSGLLSSLVGGGAVFEASGREAVEDLADDELLLLLEGAAEDEEDEEDEADEVEEAGVLDLLDCCCVPNTTCLPDEEFALPKGGDFCCGCCDCGCFAVEFCDGCVAAAAAAAGTGVGVGTDFPSSRRPAPVNAMNLGGSGGSSDCLSVALAADACFELPALAEFEDEPPMIGEGNICDGGGTKTGLRGISTGRSKSTSTSVSTILTASTGPLTERAATSMMSMLYCLLL